jgi:tetratricopeptide (TPR) repeat protein
MVTESKYDFFGGYDHSLGAGLVHTSNHHVAPGKKMWTWGNAEFGYAWDRNLTDEDGPYVELMAGAFTDNQPDFSWLQPYETKTFSQYWYPIQKIGPAKNANTKAAVNLEIDTDGVWVGVCVTSQRSVRVLLTRLGIPLIEESCALRPGEPFTKRIDISESKPEEYRLSVLNEDGEELIAYAPEIPTDRRLPDAATEPLPPEQIASIEELYLTGLHLEQYRHATRSPEAYWYEGLRREPEDARLNNAIGLMLLRKGRFSEAEKHFTSAVRRLTLRNPNPYDGEPFYNLGLACLYQGKDSEAYDAFYKCVWNYAWQSAGYYSLAAICAERDNLDLALEQVELCLQTNAPNLNARALKASLLRRMNHTEDAKSVIDETIALDPLCFRVLAERVLLTGAEEDLRVFVTALDRDVQTLLDVAFELAWTGLRDDAYLLLKACSTKIDFGHPMLWFTLSWLAASLGIEPQSMQYAAQAEAASPLYCFPARLEEMIVLEDAINRNPSSARAHYYLGNLYYDKRRYQDAMRCWRRSVELDGEFSIPWRNLGLAEFNVSHNPGAADQMYARAFAANSSDARLLYEWDQLKKRVGSASPEERLRFLGAHEQLVSRRDDLTVEYITLLNQGGYWQAALNRLLARRFSPWEGGEGLVSAQYVYAHRAMGMEALTQGRGADALQHFEAARKYPENLGEGKHLLTLERDLDYLAGLATEQLGVTELAGRYWNAAAAPLSAPGFHSYFQALALQALGKREAAREVLSSLSDFARTQLQIKPKIDYFATSLPNLLLFDDDLDKRNRIDSILLGALAKHGLGEVESAVRNLQQLNAEDPNHLLVAEMLGWIQSGGGAVPERPEVESAS